MENKFIYKTSGKLGLPATWKEYYEYYGEHDGEHSTHYVYYCIEDNRPYRTSTRNIFSTFDSKLLRIFYGI